MKVEKNITVFAGAEPNQVRAENAAQKQEDERERRKDSTTFFAGDFQGDKSLQERILQRKEQAQKQALKIVKDAWEKDQAIDQGMEESREHIRQMQEENQHIQSELRDVDQRREELKKTYGVTDDTAAEDMPQEYRDRLRELNDYANYNKELLGENQLDIIGENAAIRGTRQEKLKRSPEHTMVGAKEQAQETLEAVGDEIIGMVMDDAKKHLDEEQKEREEQAEKLQEKREEAEQLQEKREEDREDLEELIGHVPVDEMLDLDRSRTDIRQEVRTIADKMKLVAEDLKGTMVDKNI